MQNAEKKCAVKKCAMEKSSVTEKVFMSLTGLFLCLFLVVHLGGNLLLFKQDGGAAFNAYSHFMETSWIIRVIEIFLLLFFLTHIFMAIKLTIKNKQARPVSYAVNKASENSSWFSRNMEITGGVIFIFLCVHLYNFMFSQRFFHHYPSMYAAVRTVFQNPWYVLFYVICLSWVGFHLIHGVQSSFQSLGLRHPIFTPWIKKLGVLFAALIFLGFLSLPVYFFFSRTSRRNVQSAISHQLKIENGFKRGASQ
jgi:succinate dehydrogenase / fumarate reductase cytochrome b subunit